MAMTNCRRSFLVTMGRALALTALVPRVLAEAAEQFPAGVAELYRKSVVIDTLCAPFTSADSLPDKAAIDAVRQSGITAINFTISGRSFEETIDNLAYVDALVEQSPDVFTVIRIHADIARAKREGKIGIIPGFQYTQFLEDNPSRIETFRRLGVRIMQLTYNNRSIFGDGCLEPGNAGLSKAGHDAVRKMNELGAAVDLSHSGYRTTSEAIEASQRPVLITHSGCASIYAHPRNKPDDVMKALADKGGYFGVYLMPYLVASPTVPTHEHVINHVLCALNICGADHVGIGSDGSIQSVSLTPEQKKAFDEDIARRKKLGIGAPGEDRYPYVPDLNGPDHMEAIAAELQKRGQPSAVIEKVLGANFQRVIGEIWSET
ncbi:MAG TPA: membrane dipeptidase [Candidatus Eisenbacteria bacterium]|nr:membrane dipeptidase [Candidatus Eisenbacteria bacterium]